MKRPVRINNGQTVKPKMKGFRTACCDCGLVHRFDFRVVGKTVEFTVWRDEKATAQWRRQKTN